MAASPSAAPTTTTTITPAETVSVLDHLDDMLAKELAPPKPTLGGNDVPPPSSLGAAGGGPPSPSPAELIEQNRRRTAVRLDQLERLLRTQEAELQSRDSEIQRQQDELRALRQENREMHKFLADYGLQWVGGRSQGASASASAASSAAPTPPGTAGGAGTASGGAARGALASEQPESSKAASAASQQPAAAQPSSGRPSSSSRRGSKEAGGGGGGGKAGGGGGAGGADVRTKPTHGGVPDMEKVRRAVSELNSLAEQGSGEIVRRRDGSHGFATPSITLNFWHEGLQLDSGALRKYSEPEAIAFLRDLLDGYFPYELKHAFPEGVVFEVGDHTSRPFGAAPSYDWGAGRKLDSRGDARVTQLVADAGKHEASKQPQQPPQQSRFPRQAGQPLAGGGRAATAVGGAGAGGATLGGGQAHLAGAMGGGARMWQNPVAEAGSGGAAAGMDFLLGGGGGGALVCGGVADGAAASGELCRLQVKGTNGQMACVIELPSTATLASVHSSLLEQHVVTAGSKYELRTAFPSKPLPDPNRTLAALGLVPSATLCVRMVA